MFLLVFRTFKWALTQGDKVPIENGLEHPELPDGTGEFLDSWLILLEKMVNPKMILESPHTLPAKSPSQNSNYAPFDPVKYLINTQKQAFECVMHLWNKKPLKTYGERMSESMLTILCHLLKGETIIQEKLAKEKEGEGAVEGSAAAGVAATGAARPAARRNELEDRGVNPEHLQQLVDMGFSRELAVDALDQVQTLEAATEYLLSNPGPIAGRIPGAAPPGDWDMSEEDQMHRAIAMSLGENVAEEEEAVEENRESEPLPKDMMDNFTKDILPGCLRLLDTLPDTVYRVCDLLLAVSQRNGEKWIQDMLRQLIGDISENVSKLLKSTEPMTSGDRRSVNEWGSQISQLPEASRAATRIHVFSLLFEEKRNECAFLIRDTELILGLIQLLEATQNTLSLMATSTTTPVSTPKWLATVILLVDLFDKAAIASSRKEPLLRLHRRQWKWFDDRTGKWTTYISSNNKTIDDAYKNGEMFVRFAAGRRKYTVQFCTMVQINEETGNWRPIMFVNDDKAMDISEEPGSSTSKAGSYKVVPGLQSDQRAALVRACVGFMNVPVEPDTLHAVMRLCLRLTRQYEHASLFAELGGVKAILQLTQASAFTGFNSLATLIVRHVLEEPQTLRLTMEKVIRTQTHHSPSQCKEMHYILRVLGPAACRESGLFSEVSKSTLRINLNQLTRREEDDTRLQGPNAVQTLKLLPAKPSLVTPSQASPVIKTLISDLLNSLTVKTISTPSEETKDSPTTSGPSDIEGTAARLRTVIQHRIAELEGDDDSELEPRTSELKPAAPAVPNKEEESKKNRSLMAQSSLLRLLAELARSYNVVAKLITEYVYHPGQSELITEDCSALSFILDHLLPSSHSIGDKDSPALARVLVASIASCNHCPDAQTTLVNEVKSALHRALALVESAEKHNKIQAITGILTTMIESCPNVATPPVPNTPNSVRTPPATVSSIVKIMLRRSLINDLARVTHSLDLSSPHMAMTVNSALKPLETLSRIINTPTPFPANQPKKTKLSSDNVVAAAQEAMDEDGALPGSMSATLSEIMTNLVQETESLRSAIGGAQTESTAGVTTETSTSETNAFGEVTVDDNTDNEGVVIDESSPFYPTYRDPIRTDADLLEDEMRNDGDIGDDSSQHIGDSHVNEVHENVVNSHNGAESESGEDSDDSDDEEDDDDNSPDEEEHEDEEDDEDHPDDEDDDGDDDGDGSAYVDDHDLEESMLRFGERGEDFMFDIEDMLPPSMFTDGSFRLSSLLPMLESESHIPSAGDSSQPSVPPAPGNVAISHPLLVRHSDIGAGVSMSTSNTNAASILASRTHRSGRQRLYRPPAQAGIGGVSPWQLPSHFHQRHPIVGPAGATGTSAPAARVIFSSNDFQIIAADEDLYEVHDPTFNSSSSALGVIPSAMVRWTEESRVLDGDSMHDCVASIKPEIIEVWEKFRDEEIAERKGIRKNMIEDDEKQKKEIRDKKAAEAAASKPNTTDEAKVENESVNDNTERVVESLIEQVLGPAIGSAVSSSSTRAEPASSMELVEATSVPESSTPQTDNEISEMMLCAETTTEPERPADAMDVNGDSLENAPVPTPTEAVRAVAAPTPDLSTLANSSSEGNGNDAGSVLNEAPVAAPGPLAPEPNNIVEVANNDANANSGSRTSAENSGKLLLGYACTVEWVTC